MWVKVFPIKDGKEISSMVTSGDAVHGAMRRSIAGAFTPAATLEYENSIDVTIAELLEFVGKKKVFNLNEK